MRLQAVLLLGCLLLGCSAFGQHTRKASRFYNKAQKSWSHYQKNDAYEKMRRSISKAPHAPAGYSQLGEWYFTQHKFPQAVQVFNEASEKCPRGRQLFALPLAKSLIYCGSADSALRVIGTYSTVKDSAIWNKLARQANFVRQGMMHMLPVTPVSLGTMINSPYPDLFPSMTVDTETIYFTRRVKNVDEDFFVAKHDPCEGWLSADNMGAPPNTINNESAQFISADGHYLFFSRSDNRSDNGWAEGGQDLFMAYRIGVDSDWTVPQPFGATINTPSYEGMPSLSPDNRQLFFVSDCLGGYGGLDIWVSNFENGLWQLPVNAGPGVNTAGDETAPYISLDSKTLFFTSNGHPGFGGTDIYMSKRVNDTSWSKATNLGYPINTAFNEQSEWIVKNGHRMLFASDRQGPAGNFDLYETELPFTLQPAEISFVEGYVYDSLTRERLNSANMFIINADRGDTVYQVMSNRGDASYLIPLSMKTNYAIHAARIGYSEIRDTFSFDKPYVYHPLVHNISMLPVDYVKPIFDSLLATIHFNINKVDLSDSDKMVITRALDPFLLDKGVIYYVNAFTDNTGTPMINQELSTKRANQVAKILTDLGIDDLSIVAKGWGEAKMIASNDDEEGQRKNRRVEIMIRR